MMPIRELDSYWARSPRLPGLPSQGEVRIRYNDQTLRVVGLHVVTGDYVLEIQANVGPVTLDLDIFPPGTDINISLPQLNQFVLVESGSPPVLRFPPVPINFRCEWRF